MNEYPWLAEPAQQILTHQPNLAHAWLISGAQGVGKFAFGQLLAQSLLCEHPMDNGLACGACVACGWVKQHHHPDLKYLYPTALHPTLFPELPELEATASQEIRVDQLRSLDDWFHASTHRAGYRVVIIYPAEQMNAITANTLLKILEEPAPRTIFLLLTAQTARLLPTVISRCQRFNLPNPEPEQALAWLEAQQIPQAAQWLAAYDGAPLLAKEAAQSQDRPIPAWLFDLSEALLSRQRLGLYRLLDTLEEEPFAAIVTVLQRFVLDIQCLQFALPVRHYPALGKTMAQLAQRNNALRSAHLLKQLNERQLTAQHPFNAKLRLQSLLDTLMEQYA